MWLGTLLGIVLLHNCQALQISIRHGNTTSNPILFPSPSFESGDFHHNATALVRLPRSGKWDDCSNEIFDDDQFVLIAPGDSSCYLPALIKDCRKASSPGIIFVTRDKIPGFLALIVRIGKPESSSIFVEVSVSDGGDYLLEQLELDTEVEALIVSDEPNEWLKFVESTWLKILSTFVTSMSIINIGFVLIKAALILRQPRTRWPYTAGFVVLLFELIANLLRSTLLINLGWCQCLPYGWLLMAEFGSVGPFLISRISVAMCWRESFVSLRGHKQARASNFLRDTFPKAIYWVLVSAVLALEISLGVIPATTDTAHIKILSVFYCLILLITSVGFIWQYSALSNTGHFELGEASRPLRRIMKRGLISSYLVLLFIVGMLTISLPWRGQPQVFIILMAFVQLVANLVSTFNIDSVMPRPDTDHDWSVSGEFQTNIQNSAPHHSRQESAPGSAKDTVDYAI